MLDFLIWVMCWFMVINIIRKISVVIIMFVVKISRIKIIM